MSLCPCYVDLSKDTVVHASPFLWLRFRRHCRHPGHLSAKCWGWWVYLQWFLFRDTPQEAPCNCCAGTWTCSDAEKSTRRPSWSVREVSCKINTQEKQGPEGAVYRHSSSCILRVHVGSRAPCLSITMCNMGIRRQPLLAWLQHLPTQRLIVIWLQSTRALVWGEREVEAWSHSLGNAPYTPGRGFWGIFLLHLYLFCLCTAIFYLSCDRNVGGMLWP